MKIKFALASLLLVGLSHCGSAVEKEANNIQTCDAQCQATATTLKASFVSGHLGNYEDCPDEGYSAKTAPAGDQDIAAGNCEAGVSCPTINNCEKASLILQLSNGGDNDALGILIQKIELKNEAGETVAILPLESVTRVDDNQQFSGKIIVDETTIRIDFQGPANPYELLSGSSNDTNGFGAPSGVLHITLSSDNADDVIVISPITSTIPAIAT